MTEWEYRVARSTAKLRDAIQIASGMPAPIRLPAPRPPKPAYVRPADLPCLEIERIKQTVANFYGIEPCDMTSQSRARYVARPRQLAVYLARQMTGKSFPELGRRFGGRDHTTILHAIREVERRTAAPCDEAEDLAALQDMLSPMEMAA